MRSPLNAAARADDLVFFRDCCRRAVKDKHGPSCRGRFLMLRAARDEGEDLDGGELEGVRVGLIPDGSECYGLF